jgi:hypothetical protein
MYLRITNNEISYPYTIKDLKAAHRNITFPNEIGEETMTQFGLYEVEQTPKPNDYTKNITEGTPILTDGVYYQNWIQTDASQSEIDYRLENQWFIIRETRNELLTECDWTQLSDIPTETKTIWSEYRQSLRDITSQTNPFSITWPVKP